jgi:3'-phosphoadenosine 5'-phosphosulfate (PAPS) 3'-phosphatase
VDRGLEPPRGEGERCWVLDPIDGTKGFMTGQGFVIGLALLDAHGDALVGVMGVPAWLKAAPGRRHDPRGRPAPWG